MKRICMIRANDALDGDPIRITAEPAEYDGENGFRLAASNGDDVGYYKPQSLAKCQADAHDMWGRWATYRALEPTSCN